MSISRRAFASRIARLATGPVVALAVASCVLPSPDVPARESFDSASTFTRTYPIRDALACEAARRTLLSQGYVVSIATAAEVRGRKSFQPTPERHVEIELNVVCAREGYKGVRTIAFVNAVQDTFALKKSSSSASLGLPAFGAVSLPFTASDDSMVKVASVTVTNATFYDRFFQILELYLAGDPGQPFPAVDAASGAASSAPASPRDATLPAGAMPSAPAPSAPASAASAAG